MYEYTALNKKYDPKATGKATTCKSAAILNIRRVERREGKPPQVCQSHKGNDHSPFGRLGKYGIRESSSKVVQHHSETAHYRGVSIYLLALTNNEAQCVIGFKQQSIF